MTKLAYTRKMVDKTQNKKRISKENVRSKEAHIKAKQPRRLEKDQNVKRAKRLEQDKNVKKVQPSNNRQKVKQADEKSARQNKAKSIKKLFTWTILIGIIVGILVFLCKSEMFEICNIEVTGNNQIPQQVILESSQINLKDNIFLSNTIKAKNGISKNPYVKEVNIKRMLPDKIQIEIVEKQKSYMIQMDGKYAYIDQYGDILEISEIRLDNLIVLQGYSTLNEEIEAGKTLNEEDLERLKDTQKILQSGEKNELNDKIASINIKDNNDYILSLPEYKKIVYIGDTSNLSTKMLRTKDIIDKTMEKEGKIFVNGKFNKGFDPYFREEPNN